jgi:hypothetical protein
VRMSNNFYIKSSILNTKSRSTLNDGGETIHPRVETSVPPGLESLMPSFNPQDRHLAALDDRLLITNVTAYGGPDRSSKIRKSCSTFNMIRSRDHVSFDFGMKNKQTQSEKRKRWSKETGRALQHVKAVATRLH